jgi:hypothetical protein
MTWNPKFFTIAPPQPCFIDTLLPFFLGGPVSRIIVYYEAVVFSWRAKNYNLESIQRGVMAWVPISEILFSPLFGRGDWSPAFLLYVAADDTEFHSPFPYTLSGICLVPPASEWVRPLHF